MRAACGFGIGGLRFRECPRCHMPPILPILQNHTNRRSVPALPKRRALPNGTPQSAAYRHAAPHGPQAAPAPVARAPFGKALVCSGDPLRATRRPWSMRKLPCRRTPLRYGLLLGATAWPLFIWMPQLSPPPEAPARCAPRPIGMRCAWCRSLHVYARRPWCMRKLPCRRTPRSGQRFRAWHAHALRLVRAGAGAGSHMSEAAMQQAAMARVSEQLWNAVEHGEIRLNRFPTRAQYARSLTVALPRELDRRRRLR